MTTTIGKAFLDAKYLYGDSSSKFYIDINDVIVEGDHTFIHEAELPPYKHKIFTEYLPSNLNDVVKLYHEVFPSDKTSHLKSFFCSLCSSMEPNNVAISTGDNIKSEKNMSAIIRYNITLGNIKFNVTGTAHQYLVNHLLLFPDIHSSSYLFVLSLNEFSSLYNILINHAPKNTILIFNGNFGSDIYHSHFHLTNQPPYIVPYCKKLITRRINGQKLIGIEYNEQEEDSDGEEDSNSTTNFIYNDDVHTKFIETACFKVTLVYSENLEKMHTELSKYYRLYLDPTFDSTKYFISTTHFTFKENNIQIYATIIMAGDFKIKKQSFGNCKINTIAPSYLIVLPPTVCDEDDYSEVLVSLSNFFIPGSELYKLSRPVKLIEEMYPLPYNIATTPSEVTELYATRDLSADPFMDDNKIEKYEKLVKYYVNVKCPARDTHTCKYTVFGAFKFIFSLWFLNKINRKVVENKNALTTAITQLYNDPQVMDICTSAEIYKLRHTYGIKTDSLVLRGQLANDIAKNTIKRLLELSKSNPSTINTWTTYIPAELGDDSSFGYVTKSVLDNDNDLPLAIKAIRTNAPTDFDHELTVGLHMSKYRKVLPNFVMVYGSTSCLSAKDHSTICVRNKNNIKELRPYNYLFMEYINGMSLREYIIKVAYQPNSDVILLYILQQTLLSLAFAQETDEFTHYDLHAGNMLLTESSNKQFIYVGNKQKYRIYAPYTVVIIDYGTTHIKGLDNYPKSPYEETYGMTIDKFKVSADIYTVLTDILILIVAYNPEYYKAKKIKYLYDIYEAIYGELYTESVEKLIIEAINSGDDYKTFYKRLAKARVDGKAPIYLPYDYDNEFTPMMLYEEIRSILEIEYMPRNYTTCYWGNIKKRGCD